MKDNDKSYPWKNRRHKFYKNEKSQKDIRDSFKLVQCIDKEGETENKEAVKIGEDKRKRKNIKKLLECILFFIIIVAISAFLVEVWLIPNGLYNPAKMGSIISVALAAFLEVVINWNKLKYLRKYDESFWEGIINAAKQCWNVLKRFSMFHLFLLIVAGLWVGGRIGKEELLSKAERGIKAAAYAMKHEETEVLSDSEVQSPEMVKVLSGKDDETIEKAKSISVSGDEKEREMRLSSTDSAAVYFERGAYSILDLECQSDIEEMIKQFVVDQRKKEKENIFDKPVEEGGAPPEVEEVIANASEMEKAAVSLEEIEEDILGVREDAYLRYPKPTLAQLISNGYEMIALTLMAHGGNIESINYYYGKSILKDFEYLEYAGISDQNIKKKLMKISQKYEDIRVLNPDWKTRFPNVEKLRDAFKKAADQY